MLQEPCGRIERTLVYERSACLPNHQSNQQSVLLEEIHANHRNNNTIAGIDLEDSIGTI